MEQKKQEILSKLIKESLEDAEAKGVRKGLFIALTTVINTDRNSKITKTLFNSIDPTVGEFEFVGLDKVDSETILKYWKENYWYATEKETTEGSQKGS